MKLKCGVFGEGTVFSVENECDADVKVLQVTIANRYKVVSNRVELFPGTLSAPTASGTLRRRTTAQPAINVTFDMRRILSIPAN